MHRFIRFARRALPSLGILTAGIFLSSLIFTILRGLEEKNVRAAFNGVAQERLDALETNVTLATNNLVSLGALYDASREVERGEFGRFAACLLARRGAIQALEWIPRVPRSSRQRYEEAAQRDGFPSFQFSERLSPGHMVRARERKEYFPVFFVEPLPGNEKALGFDLASDPVRRATLELSASAGGLVATSRVTLVQETTDQYGFLVFRPVYRGARIPSTEEQRRVALTGFELAVFRVADIVEKGHASPSTASGLNVLIFDRDAKPGERLLYPKGAHLDGVGDLPKGFRETRTISVAGRTWELAVYPVSNSFRPERWASWAAMAAGLLLTFLLTTHLAERKQGEEALQASKEQYRSLVYNVPDVVWTADAGGHFAFVSPNVEALTGLTLEEIYTQGADILFGCIHPADLQMVREGFRALFVQGRRFDVECRFRRKNGEWIWVRGRSVATYERNGVLYADGLLSDITARKRVEERLRVQYEATRALAECDTLSEATPAILQSLCEALGWDCGVLWDVDRSANVLRWVGGWHSPLLNLVELEESQRQITFSPGVGVAGSVWSSGAPAWIADITGLDGYIKIAAARGLRAAVTFPIVSGGVVLSVMQLFSGKVEPPDERVLEMLMTVASQIGPLIDRQRAEDALQKSEERARLLFAVIPHPAYAFDLKTLEFLEINDAAVKDYGYSRDEFLQMKTTDIRPPEEVERLKKHLQQVQSPSGAAGHWKHRSKDGRIIDVEVNFQSLEYDGHKALLAIAQDMTERNRLEVELRHSQKLEAVGSLAAGIAHEINTPIQFVGDNTQFLHDAFRDLAKVLDTYHRLRDAAANGGVGQSLLQEVIEAETAVDIEYLTEEIPKAIGQSLEGVRSVATIVRAMKEFAHPGCSEKTATDLTKALESTLIVARNEIKYVADVQTDFAQLPPVYCNAGDMNQVFLNLLVNAAHAIGDVVKGTSQRGLIRIGTSAEEDGVLITISDTGCGIPENIRNRVFDPFFTTKERGRGTGQGLAIARSVVVDKHGGTLTLSSEVGKGTTFYIRLPLSEKAKQGEGKPSNPPLQV